MTARRSAVAAVAAAIVAATAAFAGTLALRPDAGPPADVPVNIVAQVRPSESGPAATIPAGWQLAFAEEFDGDRLDDETWHTCFWWAPNTCTIEPHQEMGLYRQENVSVADGVLTLRARPKRAIGWNGETYDYTSGLVSTGGSDYSDPARESGFVFTYGYAEARIQVPAGQGLVPAFWLPTADHSWPPEIDIMEMLGNDPTRTTMHYHYRRSNGTKATVGDSWRGPDFSAGWHTFGVDWQPGSLTWYVDGIERYRFVDAAVTDQPAFLLLNLAVGGTWAGAPDPDTAFPADLLVDYVRVFQRSPSVS